MNLRPTLAGLTGLALLSGCDLRQSTEPERAAALLIGGAENPIISAGAFMASERVEALYASGELRDLPLARAIVQRYLEIGAPWEAAITPAQAHSHLNAITAQASSAGGNALTACARTELLRQAAHIRSLVTRATTPGGAAPGQNDITPHSQGAWPWGGCPAPAAVQNLSLARTGSAVTVSWTHAQPQTEFAIYEIRPAGPSLITRLDSDDCGDAPGVCTTGPRSLTFSTSATSVIVQVDACQGLNCSSQRAAVGLAVPPPVADLTFSRHGHTVTVQWVPVAGADYYEVVESATGAVGRVTQPVYVDAKAKKDDKLYTYQVRTCNLAGCSAFYTESFRK